MYELLPSGLAVMYIRQYVVCTIAFRGGIQTFNASAWSTRWLFDFSSASRDHSSHSNLPAWENDTFCEMYIRR
jgi:hypothetical protein